MLVRWITASPTSANGSNATPALIAVGIAVLLAVGVVSYLRNK
ncbi:MAG: hypothetical protein JWP10_684 [Nocardioidaceae bacterium]|nr:hypothetical protein [Nocardioidaceae bacterium]